MFRMLTSVIPTDYTTELSVFDRQRMMKRVQTEEGDEHNLSYLYKQKPTEYSFSRKLRLAAAT